MPHTPTPGRTVLLVQENAAERARTASLLHEGGYRVLVASSFEEAKRLMRLADPDLFLTDIRLGAFNGLHLVVRSQANHPRMLAIVLDEQADPFLKADAERHGATYLVKPVEPQALLDAVAGKLQVGSGRQVRRWPRKELPTPIRATIGNRAGELIDVSYGGVRLDVKGPAAADDISGPLEVAVPEFSVAVRIQPIWTRSYGLTGICRMGAALMEGDVPAWRRLVDSLA